MAEGGRRYCGFRFIDVGLPPPPPPQTPPTRTEREDDRDKDKTPAVAAGGDNGTLERLIMGDEDRPFDPLSFDRENMTKAETSPPKEEEEEEPFNALAFYRENKAAERDRDRAPKPRGPFLPYEYNADDDDEGEGALEPRYSKEETDLPTELLPPFKVRLTGVGEGKLLIRFLDWRTVAQFKQLQEDIEHYFKTMAGRLGGGKTHEDAEIVKNILCFADWREEMERKEPLQGPKPEFRFVRAQVLLVNLRERRAYLKDVDSWLCFWTHFSDIYKIPHCFLQTPFWVRRMNLKDLEFWSEGNVLKEVSYLIPGISEVATLTLFDVPPQKTTTADLFPSLEAEVRVISCLKTEALPLFRDVQTTTLGDLYKYCISGFTRVPRMFFRGHLIEQAHICMIEVSGEVYILMSSAIQARLHRIGENPKLILSSDAFNPTLNTTEPKSDFDYAWDKGERRFLSRFKEDRNYYRVDVLDYRKGKDWAKVRFTDFGNVDWVPVEDLLPSAFVDPLLNKVPPQTVKARLKGIASFTDVDPFFDTFSINQKQKFIVSGFEYEKKGKKLERTPLVDAYILREGRKTKKDRWVFINQVVLDKGLGSSLDEKVVTLLQHGSPPQREKRPLDPFAKEVVARYKASCRIVETFENEEDGEDEEEGLEDFGFALLTLRPCRRKGTAKAPKFRLGTHALRDADLLF